MALDLRDCTFFGPALPEPFVKYQLEKHLKKRSLLTKSSGDDGKALRSSWDTYRRKLRMLGEQGGERRVANHVLEPLMKRLAYEAFAKQETVLTREGAEDGGYLMTAAEGAVLRCWSVSVGTDLDAPNRRGRAYRFSPSRIAQRVLLAKGERVGLLTNGEELRLLICDPARSDSHIGVGLDRSGGWRGAYRPPDSYRLIVALASPAGIDAVPELTDAARLAQSAVTDKLRIQARRAVEGFVQALLDHPDNAGSVQSWEDVDAQAKRLWHEGLILVYRLLFIFKLESSADAARAFSFATTALWRDTYSPNVALAGLVRKLIDEGADTGGMLEDGLRTLFRMFSEGMRSSELNIRPLGGMLFGQDAIPLIDGLRWGEHAVAQLLDHLLWTPSDKKTERERVHYGTLDVEDMGRVYEALIELEPGISSEPMCRLKRAKLEVVVPAVQGEPYRAEAGEKESGKTKVEWIEEIPSGRFYLRVGLGRKASGSYYTPHPFVRFLVQETLGPQIEERSPRTDPQPGRLLELTVLDPAMGSGHFLVEACRYLGDALYEACRLCDELAVQAEKEAESAATDSERQELLDRAHELWKRVEDLPDPEDELLAYLPSRAAEGEESGLSQQKAEAMCRRLVAVHCLYGVDKNPLAVELAKLSLWLESYAEGLPLTFLDHRLICGDSLTGPFFEHLMTCPGSGEKLDDLFSQGLTQRLTETLEEALRHVDDLEASVGKDVADLEQKRVAKQKLDEALQPFKLLAAAWSGGVMLGNECDDQAYAALARAVADQGDAEKKVDATESLSQMVELGCPGAVFEFAFPEVFWRGASREIAGFHAVLGNPPWDKIRTETREAQQLVDPEAMLGKERGRIGINRQLGPKTNNETERIKAIALRLGLILEQSSAGDVESHRLFIRRSAGITGDAASSGIGIVLPGGFMRNPADSIIRTEMANRGSIRFALHFVNSKRIWPALPQVAETSCLCWSGGRSEVACFDYDLASYPDEGSLERAREFSAVDIQEELSASGLFPGTRQILPVSGSLADLTRSAHISLKTDVHRTAAEDAMRNVDSVVTGASDAREPITREKLLAKGFIPCYSSRSIDQHNSYSLGLSGKWHRDVDVVVDLNNGRIARIHGRLQHFRLVVRSTCGRTTTSQRSAAACLLPPMNASSNSLWAESEPESRPNCDALAVAACINSFVLDWGARSLINANFNKGVMANTAAPGIEPLRKHVIVHGALRLECALDSFRALWIEQLGEAWREPTPRHTWPVLEDDDERWAVRAAIDAVVADAYGLDREQYAHVLSTFSHKSYPKAPELCLAAFNELRDIGLEAFTKKHDPYWDIPLNEELPKPVIDLPIQIEPATQVREATLPLYGAQEAEEEDE